MMSCRTPLVNRLDDIQGLFILRLDLNLLINNIKHDFILLPYRWLWSRNCLLLWHLLHDYVFILGILLIELPKSPIQLPIEFGLRYVLMEQALLRLV